MRSNGRLAAGAQMSGHRAILRVAIPGSAALCFDYRAPDGRIVEPGCRVRVPLGSRDRVGMVVECPAATPVDDEALRPVGEVIDEAPVVSAQLLSLLQWLAGYYHHPLSAVLRTALPPPIRAGAGLKEVAPERQPPQAGSHRLNAQQQRAIETVRTGFARFNCYLLEGVTGSGKTEVYLNLCESVVGAGRQVLVLVPEIALTLQTVSRFHERLGGGVMSFHSGLTPARRLDCWSAVFAGGVNVVIGTRSAVFMPFRDLGLVIVDEEHDSSYKQEDSLRYHARDVAIKRAQRANVPVVLGSATPSLESLHNAAGGKYRHLRLPHRVGRHARLACRLVDMRGQAPHAGLSQALINAMRERLAKDEQVLLFVNRRGYAPVMLCRDCGQSLDCARCDAHMVFHLHDRKLHCHHCGKISAVPRQCPACGRDALHAAGVAIEQVEQALHELFPAAGIARFDTDAVRKKDQLEQRLGEVHSGEAGILLGTQMLIKGHHFRQVSLVGVLNADNGLFSPDFRALERLAQTIVQVSGRAGRGDVPGEVIIQTFHPDHPQLVSLLQDGYAAFASQLLAARAAAALPPHYRCAVFRAEALRIEAAMDFLTRVAKLAARTEGRGDVQFYDPMPALMEKRVGYYRARLVLKSADGHLLRRFLARLMPQAAALRGAAKLRWHLDVDPIEFD